MKKYEFTEETKIIGESVLHRIRSICNFCDIHPGLIGGFIAQENNLSHADNSWIGEDACVLENAHVSGDTIVYDRITNYYNVEFEGR